MERFRIHAARALGICGLFLIGIGLIGGNLVPVVGGGIFLGTAVVNTVNPNPPRWVPRLVMATGTVVVGDALYGLLTCALSSEGWVKWIGVGFVGAFGVVLVIALRARMVFDKRADAADAALVYLDQFLKEPNDARLEEMAKVYVKLDNIYREIFTARLGTWLRGDKAILCLKCGSLSWNKGDYDNIYCGKCGYHEREHKASRIVRMEA